MFTKGKFPFSSYKYHHSFIPVHIIQFVFLVVDTSRDLLAVLCSRYDLNEREMWVKVKVKFTL